MAIPDADAFTDDSLSGAPCATELASSYVEEVSIKPSQRSKSNGCNGSHQVGSPAITLELVEINRVVDGDTIDVTIDLGFDLFKKERVRVAGVDTPEKRTRDLEEKELGYDATN